MNFTFTIILTTTLLYLHTTIITTVYNYHYLTSFYHIYYKRLATIITIYNYYYLALHSITFMTNAVNIPSFLNSYNLFIFLSLLFLLSFIETILIPLSYERALFHIKASEFDFVGITINLSWIEKQPLARIIPRRRSIFIAKRETKRRIID